MEVLFMDGLGSINPKKKQIVWDGQPINLTNLCDGCGLDLGTLAVWEANGERLPSSSLNPGEEPSDLEPTIFRVKMLQASNPDIVWDQIFIVVNNRKTKTRYDKWVTKWTAPDNKIFAMTIRGHWLIGGLAFCAALVETMLALSWLGVLRTSIPLWLDKYFGEVFWSGPFLLFFSELLLPPVNVPGFGDSTNGPSASDPRTQQEQDAHARCPVMSSAA